ncbi:M20 family metallopeptidase [Geobacter sp. AOG1]|uniref:M20 family metallopeptidase n=1 Tax=Geobacter sp. AOG1 TaxID=1566346 RepID=UPI001CC3D14E|nr:M20 family metallopeptidase [Geobacter sp. AOG1]GFE56906.1 hydrolase [Geobacter sp. AOG1]
MELAALKQAIAGVVGQRRNELTDIAEQLFRFPETGLQEYRSAALLADILEREGFRLERSLAGMDTAFRAAYGSDGPTIAILAEMDALPGLGHACGHNVIAAAAVGAAIALRQAVPIGEARIVVLGTPAEELGIGKVELVKAGIFQGVDAAMMVHPSSRRLVIKHYLGLARIRFTFFGRPAHAAAYPEEGVNALDGVIQTFNGINALRQQLRQDVRVHGIITDGGVAPNIIPATAACHFYVRATDLDEVGRVRERVVACAEGAARATGCRLEVAADERVLAPLKINHTLSGLYSEQLVHLGLPEATAPADKNLGSSDIGNVSQVVPTIHPHVPIGAGVHIHTEDFARATISEQGREAVVEGATAMALTAAELIARPELRKKMWDEFTGS